MRVCGQYNTNVGVSVYNEGVWQYIIQMWVCLFIMRVCGQYNTNVGVSVYKEGCGQYNTNVGASIIKRGLINLY